MAVVFFAKSQRDIKIEIDNAINEGTYNHLSDLQRAGLTVFSDVTAWMLSTEGAPMPESDRQVILTVERMAMAASNVLLASVAVLDERDLIPSRVAGLLALAHAERIPSVLFCGNDDVYAEALQRAPGRPLITNVWEDALAATIDFAGQFTVNIAHVIERFPQEVGVYEEAPDV